MGIASEETRARRAAKRVGLSVRKQTLSPTPYGPAAPVFSVVEPLTGEVVQDFFTPWDAGVLQELCSSCSRPRALKGSNPVAMFTFVLPKPCAKSLRPLSKAISRGAGLSGADHRASASRKVAFMPPLPPVVTGTVGVPRLISSTVSVSSRRCFSRTASATSSRTR
jgi:hypothetical protein